MQWIKEPYVISDDPSKLDINVIYQFLTASYWAYGRSKDTIKKSIENSIAFGVYHQERQIGFARVVTDKATFSWILDVIIDEDYQGQGVGQWLLDCILNHPEMKHTNFALATKDAHSFYEKFGFETKECMRLNKRKE